MGNPLKLTRTGNTSVDIQEMSNTDMDYIAHLVLRKVALESDNSTGALNVSGIGTTIGTFADTARVEAIGTKEATGATVTTTTTLSQNLVSVAETTVSPLELINKQPKPISSANLDSTIISYIQSNLANTSSPSISQYYLSSTNPATLYSGTWASVTTIEDTFGGSNGTSSTSTTLWKKTNDTLPTVIRPLKLGANGTIIEMSDTEIETITDRYRNRIVSSEIGRYTLSTSPPAGGTWVQVGDTFTDTRQQVAANTYLGVFTGEYNRTFSRLFTGVFNRNFSKAYTGIYNQNFSKAYIGNFIGNFTGVYQRLVQKSYTGQFTGGYVGNYVRSYTGSYQGAFTRVTRTANFVGYIAYYNTTYYRNFLRVRNVSYSGTYAGTYSRVFTGLYSRNYTGVYSRIFTGTYSKAYTGNFTGLYSKAYTGNFTGQYTGDFTKQYTGQYTGQFTSDTVSSSTENVTTVALWLRVA